MDNIINTNDMTKDKKVMCEDLKPKMIDLDPTVDMTDYKLNTIIDG